jgi:hypothetical protein
MRRIALFLGGLALLLAAFAVAVGVGAQNDIDAETVELIPEESAGFSARNLMGLIRRQHYHGERRIRVETTPPGATLDLFYIRAGFQKLYEQAEAPVTVLLPKRIQAGPRDTVTIRALVDGFRHKSITLAVDSNQSEVLLELEPLPNRLDAVSHVYFAGRSSLGLLLKEAPTVRVQNREDGFHVILAETARAPELAEALAELRSPLVEEIEAQQLGEDLLVRVAFAAGVDSETVELRARQSHDAIRNLHRYTVDLVPADGGAAAVEAARQALAEIRGSDVTGCNAIFDETLRRQLEPEALSRALSPRGEFTDRYLRAALRRLGEVSPGGVIRLVDGSAYRPQIPLELGAATLQAASAQGYLALLRRLVAKLESKPHRTETLRGLIAPEMNPERFAEALAKAEQPQARCRGSGA